MNKVYLITVSNHYYPQAGAGDWRGVYPNREEAEAIFAELEMEMDDQESAYLIEIRDDGYRIMDESWFVH